MTILKKRIPFSGSHKVVWYMGIVPGRIIAADQSRARGQARLPARAVDCSRWL